jgi:3-isopropylmalate dehydrogenase
VSYRISLIPGDGIGPDVVSEAVKCLDALSSRRGLRFSYESFLMGGCAIDATGVPLPEETVRGCKDADAVLLGAVGGPAWDGLPGRLRPEAGLLGLRSALGVYANLRPARLFKELTSACPLKDRYVEGGIDLLIVRELTGGIYFGERGREGSVAWDTERYSSSEIERLLRVAFEAARSRRGRLCVVDKANVLESSRLWRETAQMMSPEWRDVELSFMYVDNCAMQLVRSPSRFDVIASSNLFGDILSDEASAIVGSIGLLASASLGDSGPGLFEPIHGSAPDIAGKDAANPLATILSAAMMLRHSLGLLEEAALVEGAVGRVVARGLRTPDIASGSSVEELVGTRAMGDAVAREIGKEAA